MEKYWLPRSEFDRVWKPIQNKIFINQDRWLPDLRFNPAFKIYPLRGGCLLVQEYLKKLNFCLQVTGDKFFVIIQNMHGKERFNNVTPFMMKYPADITWDEIYSGNYISSFLFDWLGNEYFIFGDSGNWGIYAATYYDSALLILTFTEEYAGVFRKRFKVSKKEWREIYSRWLPECYREYLSSR